MGIGALLHLLHRLRTKSPEDTLVCLVSKGKSSVTAKGRVQLASRAEKNALLRSPQRPSDGELCALPPAVTSSPV